MSVSVRLQRTVALESGVTFLVLSIVSHLRFNSRSSYLDDSCWIKEWRKKMYRQPVLQVLRVLELHTDTSAGDQKSETLTYTYTSSCHPLTMVVVPG